jgi:hypothetical protein
MSDTGNIALYVSLGVASIFGFLFFASQPDRSDNKEQKATGGTRRTLRKHSARRNGTRRMY